MKNKKLILILPILLIIAILIYVFYPKDSNNEKIKPNINDEDIAKQEGTQHFIKVEDEIIIKDYYISYNKITSRWILQLTFIIT